MDYVALGEKIREERKRQNLTQAELAEQVNVTTAFIGQIERGERKLSIDTLVSVALAFNMSLDYLLRDMMLENNSSAISELISILENQDSRQIYLIIDIVKSVLEHLNSKK
jgi:transcriptional regulator with XRE-family HTH domain